MRLAVQRLFDTLANEEARLNALRDLRLLNTPPSESYDRLTRLASRLLGAPVSTVSLTDHDRQWFKSRVGVDVTEIPREQAPCSYAIEGETVFVVPDLAADPRFVGSPLVQAGIRFYAGAPLFTRAGHGLGTICVLDTVPREIDEDGRRVLEDLAGMVMSQVELQTMIGRVDPTTGLSNQNQMFEDLEDLARCRPADEAAILLAEIMPPDQAALTLRVLGSGQVEALTRMAMSVVQGQAGNGARLYQVGTMRCAVLLDDGRTAEPVARRIIAALQEPICCEGVPITPQPAVGMHAFRPAAAAPRDVFRRALNAADDARLAESHLAGYSPAHDERSARSFAVLGSFGAALEDSRQLSLVYQPRVSLLSRAMLGVEALLRWRHPELGQVSPAEFVPLVEQTALARSMTDWVVATAMRQARVWKEDGLALVTSINASALNLEERDFAARLLRATETAELQPGDVELEFTESAMARNTRRVVEQLRELRDAGMGIAIDDFGTGYSNLSYIQTLPVSVLKIDQAFVRGLDGSVKDQLLVRTMITMGHDLGHRIVAEGIETQGAFDMLRDWGCEEGQGYLLSRPVAADTIGAWRAPSRVVVGADAGTPIPGRSLAVDTVSSTRSEAMMA